MVSFYKSGVVYASGDSTLVDKTNNTITNDYGYHHGFIEDTSGNQAVSIHKNYILSDKFIEY